MRYLRATLFALFCLVPLTFAAEQVAVARQDSDLSGCPEARAASQALVERFYAPDGIANPSEVYTDEMLLHYVDAPTLGQFIDSPMVHHRPVLVQCTQAIYASTVLLNGREGDWYVYLVAEGPNWKISAVRTLALTGLLTYLVDQADADPSFAERMNQAAANAPPDIAGDAPDFDYLVANARLALSTDESLHTYYREHRDELSIVVATFALQPSLELVTSDGRTRQETSASAKDVADQLHALGLNAIAREAAYPNCVFVNVGGILDNEVGYLYAPIGCTPPEMSPSPSR
jgi:hypothetical protein